MSQDQFRLHRCRLAGVQAVEARTRHTFARHSHDQFGIGVICHGAQRSSSGRGMVEAGPGHAITVNPGEVHDGAPIGDAGRAWCMLYLEPDVIAEAIGDISEGKTTAYEFTQPVIRDDAIAARVRQLYMAATALPPGAADALPAADELLLMLLSEVMHAPHASGHITGAVPAIAHAQALIDADPAAQVTLAELAGACGLSRFQLVRAFARDTGLTPHAYLVQRRAQLARRLIAQRMPLAEAASVSGFADQSHMTRVFVRHYGFAPGAYAAALN
ncbi:MAG: AraC family transcriptional regulator [Burkholderiales bacterium]|nr:AraC family transcriptional regulator [Burkholderiales bacterium]